MVCKLHKHYQFHSQFYVQHSFSEHVTTVQINCTIFFQECFEVLLYVLVSEKSRVHLQEIFKGWKNWKLCGTIFFCMPCLLRLLVHGAPQGEECVPWTVVGNIFFRNYEMECWNKPLLFSKIANLFSFREPSTFNVLLCWEYCYTWCTVLHPSFKDVSWIWWRNVQRYLFSPEAICIYFQKFWLIHLYHMPMS